MSLVRQIGLVLVLLAGLVLALVWRDLIPTQGAGQGDGGTPPLVGGPGSAGGGPGRGGRVVPVETAVVTTQRLTDRIEALGSTRAHRAVAISPLADGRLEALPFAPGTRVAEGAILARLDDATQRADVDEAEAMVLEASQALDRARTLRRGSTVTQATLEELESRKAAALARLDRARKALDDRVIRAPFAGTVGFPEFDVGARVSEGAVITTLDDLSVVDLVFQVPEEHFGVLRPGLPVAATSTAYPDRVFSGAVIWVDPRVDPASRAVRVRARLPNPDGLLPAGLFMTLRLDLDSRDSPVVPERAILSQGGGAAVFVVSEGRVSQRPVRVGQRLGDLVELRDGVGPGELVVSAGIHRLRDGLAVRLVDGAGSAPRTGGTGGVPPGTGTGAGAGAGAGAGKESGS